MKKMLKMSVLIVGIAALAACSTGKQHPTGVVDGSGGDTQSIGLDAGPQLSAEAMAGGKDPNAIYFDLNKDVIKPEYAPVVAKYATYLSEHPSDKVRVGGYTDESGSREWNLTLSELRANAVKTALIAQGANASMIEVAGYGQEYPVPVCQGKIYCWQNRRATFAVPNA